MAKTITLNSTQRSRSFEYLGKEGSLNAMADQASSPSAPGADTIVLSIEAKGNSNVMCLVELLDKNGASIAKAYNEKNSSGSVCQIKLSDEAGAAGASSADDQSANPPVIGWKVDETDFSSGASLRVKITGKYDSLSIKATVKQGTADIVSYESTLSGGGEHSVILPFECSGS